MNTRHRSTGWAQVFYRNEGLKDPESLKQFLFEDYQPVTSIVPTEEFDALNDMMDFFHHRSEDLYLPRPLSRLDIICLRADAESQAVACIMIDEEKDLRIVKHPDVPVHTRQYYGDGSTPFFVWPAPMLWKFKEIKI